MTTPTAEELLDGPLPVARFDKEDSRWGYRETQVFKHGEKHWALAVLVTAGDEGGVEAESEPWEVHEVRKTVLAWEHIETESAPDEEARLKKAMADALEHLRRFDDPYHPVVGPARDILAGALDEENAQG
jgi:hypothetical protein